MHMFSKNYFILILLILLSNLKGLCAEKKCTIDDDGSLSYQKLVRIIQTQSCNVKSIDDLLNVLPTSILTIF
ncbi:MAG: hypothetical protein H6625_06990 [Bdellovibrionaceae bacterium]|nr:hypothetical protein [Pseudobdellovibrionaceae bacterium]